ncbi:MAG: hypothetical protein QXO70_01300, partial [Candidatus Pacearchaeota archaeon]
EEKPTEKEKKEKKEEVEKEIKKEVKEAVEEVEQAKRTGAPVEVAAKQKLVVSLAKALEGADQGILDIRDEAKELLTKIARANTSDSTLSALGEYLGLYLLGDKRMVINGQIDDVFKRRFEELRQANSHAANLFINQLSERPEKFGINKEEILKLAGIEPNKVREGATISLEEVKKVEEITQKIANLLSQKIEQRLIDLPKIEKINKAMIGPSLTSDLKAALIDLGLSSQEVSEYAQLKEKYYQPVNYDYFISTWAPAFKPLLKAAEEEFSDLSRFFSAVAKKESSLQVTRQARQEFSDLIKKYYYLILKGIHADRSKSFHENFSHHSEYQHALTVLRQIISSSADKLLEILPEQTDPDIIDFFRDKGESFQSRIFTYASLFHDLPLYTRNLGTIEKIKEFFNFLFPSQLAEFFDDETGFMQMARDVMTMMIREYLVKNKNEYRGDFLSGKYSEQGVIWNQWFRDEYKKKVKQLAKALGFIKQKEDEWKLEMIMDYSEGVGIATLIDGEVLATSDPVSHFKEVHPLMSLLSAKHNWRGGRGRDAPGKIAKFLLHTDVTLFPEVRSVLRRLWTKKRWVPEEYADWVDRAIKTYGDKILKTIFDTGGAYQELLGLFNLPASINSWNGWRVDGVLPRELNTILKFFETGGVTLNQYSDFWKSKMTGEDFAKRWREVINNVQKLYGTSAAWWTIGGAVGGAGVYRLNSELKRFLVDYYGGDIDRANYHYSEFFDEQKKMFGNRGRERIFTFGGVGGKLSLFEIRQIRQNQLRGETFFRYLRRNPADFLMIVTQLCPDLLDDSGLVFQSEKEIRGLTGKTALEKEQILGRQKELRIRWGEHFETLKALHAWLKNQSSLTGKGTISDFISLFNEHVTLAYGKHKTREEKIRRELIKTATDPNLKEDVKKQQINALINQLTFYLQKEDFDGNEKFWQIIAGDNGLIKTLTGFDFNNLDEYFQKFGSYNQLGEKNFFFTMSQSWFIKNGDINPFASDFPYYDVFKQFGTPGESTFFRLSDANIAAYKEVFSKITTLEDLLLDAAKTGKMDKIYELHKKVYDTLSGFVGPEYANRANFVLAQVVSQFFVERSILRDPKWKWLGPVGWLARELFGKNISLSKLLTNNRNAFSMDNNGLRTYYLYLTHDLGVLPEKGVWSKEQLEDAFEVTTGEFVVGDVAPTLLWFMVLFLAYSYMKKAIEETEGKK